MEYLSEDHAKLLLTKEWLVRVDSESSTPYLLKFHASTVDLSCCILITDTKSVWGEVLSSNQIARRWRDSNPQNTPSFADQEDEESWRIKCLEFISTAHSLGGLADLSFEFVKSNYSDFAFTLSGDSFRWRWETFSLGPRMSADVLSKHLILPLISMSHLAFSSADPLGTTSETNLEKSVDKVGRTARRTLDTHVRNVLSRPLLATTLQRITAMFNFVPDLPRIIAAPETPDLTPPSRPAPSRAPPTSKPPSSRRLSPSPPTNQAGPSRQTSSQMKETRQAAKPTHPPQDEDSVTEEEPEEEDYTAMSEKAKAPSEDRPRANTRDSSPARSVPSKRVTPDQSPPPKSRDRSSARQSPQPQSSSPLPAPKKMKRGKAADSSSDEEDSEEERKRHLARLKGSGPVRGAKQPLKRGGRRF